MQPKENNLVNSPADRWLSNSGKLFLPFWLITIFILISWGWVSRDQGYLTAERGTGYWLGILGASMMLLLLTYSLRKRMRALARFFSVRFWFKFHMTLGVIGPLFILFHSNFHLGSLNSTVALICMLLVAGSGFIGRYFYTRIHFGLYGEKIRLQQVSQDIQFLTEDLAKVTVTEKQNQIANRLFGAVNDLTENVKMNSGVLNLFAARKTAKQIARGFKNLIDHLEKYHMASDSMGALSKPEMDSLQNQLREDCAVLLVALKRLPSLHLFERLFSLWHVIHIPIFLLMIATAVTHIIVVHMY